MSKGGDTRLGLEDEAAVWAARIDAAPDACPPGLKSWLKADPVHAGALLRAQAVLAMFGADLHHPSAESDEPEAEPSVQLVKRRFRSRRAALTGAAVLAAICGISLYALPREEQFQAGRGEIRSLTLHDGSSVAMDSGSRITVRIGESERHVQLVEGQAMFRVRHDAGRPFQVRAGDVIITDVGTAFQVTTDSHHRLGVAANWLDGDFAADVSNRKWASDITYVWTQEGWLYLAVILDLHSRRVIGWAVSDRMKKDLAIRALDMAVRLRQPPEGCIFHSDRGSQYCSYAYQKKLQAYGLRPSMSGKGNCYDNSAVETFFKSLKAEMIWRQRWPTRRQAEASIFQYINGFYNSRRRHSYLGGISPLAFEAKVA